MNIFVTDKLRASVEAASGGQSTILYLSNGLPACFYVLERFRLENIDPSLGTGTHPAFIIEGREVPRLFIGQYHRPPSATGGQVWSWPGTMPAHVSVADNMLDSIGVAACGPGYHLLTNMEWSALALWAKANGTVPRGNNDSGNSHTKKHERGIVASGQAAGNYAILSGSGPASWRHTHTIHGVADLVGNAWDLVSGLRMVDGEIQVCENNDAAAWQDGLLSEKQWRAINFESGALVNPGTSGTLKVDFIPDPQALPAAHQGTPLYSTAREHIHLAGQWSELWFSQTLPSTDIPPIMRHLALHPAWEGLTGHLELKNSGIQYALRGGENGDVHSGSIWSLRMSEEPSRRSARIAKF